MSQPVSRKGAVGLSRPAAIAIVAGVMSLGALLGRRNAPDPSHPNIRRWYKRLDKPAFTPPNPVFGAVWPIVESGLAIGGYRLLRRRPSEGRNLGVALWLLNTGMIGGWTELFFRKRELGASALASGAMIATGAGYVAAAAKVDRPAAALGLPFVAWLGFATLLAEQVWQRNSDPDVPAS
ncbi:tryptophan-rich sensory protein [Sphingomonas spermidinifaciens]|uniref:Tryptophan-rich sensory protein n=1 Tax=Sphingomonas spermidinifaciens TaxID=1141889 RepID=A0A2A4B874_9SPHN|nr:TspO/MBR family protein [Sphingomonas spermidinifaciens]PCD03844.1 tryptophan-rich sensory protein [Sphingomonas spermidinifaciens]